MKITILLLLLGCTLARSAPPESYTKIAHIVWLMHDLKGPVRGWSSLGLTGVQDLGTVAYRGESGGHSIAGKAHVVWGHIGNVAVEMLEPQPGNPVFDGFLSRHGDGIFSIVYEAAAADEITREEARMRTSGAPVLQRMQFESARGTALFTFFDTEAKGKYVLGLVRWPGGAAPEGEPATVSHIAFAIQEAKPVSDYWQSLGFPEMPVAHATPRKDSRYHGMPLLLSFDVGWHRYTHPTFEWIIPPQQPPNCYADFLKSHGEGVHHIGLPVEDLDKAIARYKGLGYDVVQSGAWGDVGKPNSGRYAYMDTGRIGGVTAELIQSYK